VNQRQGTIERNSRERTNAKERDAALPVQPEQGRGTEASDQIRRRHRFPLDYPAGHRDPQCCVADVNKFHKSPPDGTHFIPSHRGSRTTDAKLTLFPRKVNEPKVPCYCTKVMGGLRLRRPAKRTAFLGFIVRKMQ